MNMCCVLKDLYDILMSFCYELQLTRDRHRPCSSPSPLSVLTAAACTTTSVAHAPAGLAYIILALS